MFIHWGLYALAARHEWVKNREEIDDADYQKYFDNFDPDLYDPKEWARRAREAGMKYVVLTAKHHDGFCLWDSKFTDYKATKTPYGRDLLAPFVEAFRAEGLKIGFYYSLLDWHHPDFTIDMYHPLRNREDAAALNAGRDMKRYAAYHARPGDRAADRLRPDRHHLVRLQLSRPHLQGPAGQGPRRLAEPRAAEAGAQARARHHRQQPARPRDRHCPTC